MKNLKNSLLLLIVIFAFSCSKDFDRSSDITDTNTIEQAVQVPVIGVTFDQLDQETKIWATELLKKYKSSTSRSAPPPIYGIRHLISASYIDEMSYQRNSPSPTTYFTNDASTRSIEDTGVSSTGETECVFTFRRSNVSCGYCPNIYYQGYFIDRVPSPDVFYFSSTYAKTLASSGNTYVRLSGFWSTKTFVNY